MDWHKIYACCNLSLKLMTKARACEGAGQEWSPRSHISCSHKCGRVWGNEPHLNIRFAHKVMGLQSRGNPNFGNFRTPTWESRDEMTFGCYPVARHKKYYKGKGGGFPQVRAMVSLMSLCLFLTRSCTKVALTMH
jgi:hypothetical protein